MRIIVVGCGRMGSGLAKTLTVQGHVVTVVDNDPEAFERLGPSYKGRTVLGVGFDRDVLVQAGIERSDGLAAVTPSDEANLVAARMASQIFRVPKVVARVYDPSKAEIYHRLGLQTIAPVSWGINRVAEIFTYTTHGAIASLGAGQVDIVDAQVPGLLVGRTVNEITVLGEIHVVAVSRGGKTFLPTLGTVFQSGDILHLAVHASAAGRLDTLLALE